MPMGFSVSPVIGPKKVGDFQSDLILRSYETMIKRGSIRKERLSWAVSPPTRDIVAPEKQSSQCCVEEYGV